MKVKPQNPFGGQEPFHGEERIPVESASREAPLSSLGRIAGRIANLRGGFLRFLRLQQLFIAVAVAVYAIFWAIGQDSIISVTLVYSLCLCNMVVAAQEKLRFFYVRRKAPQSWLVYLLLLSVLSPLMVLAATAVVVWTTQAGISYGTYLQNGWKFPLLATMIFGIVYEIYQVSKERLERRNRDLQHALEIEAAERELQEQELDRARDIQKGLLPKEIPQVAGFVIAGTWEPARVVGGDYFDVIRLSGGKLAICIADVAGKGVSAALLMANVQATVRAFASESAPPSWVCSRANAVLCSNIAPGKFVTFFYGVLDAERRTLRYTNAGHLGPLLISTSGASERLDAGGAVLGVFPNWKYEDAQVRLAPGDRLVLFTDGITEAAGEDGQEFGEERLREVFRRNTDRLPDELNACVLSAVKQFCKTHMADDATLLVLAADRGQGLRR